MEVWWPPLKKQYNIRKLNGMLLHQLLIDEFTRNVAACFAFRIKELRGWKWKEYGHSVILNQLNLSESDYILPRTEEHLPNSASIFQAEVEKPCGFLLNNSGRIRQATIYTDSQAVLLAFSAPRINSNVVNICRRALSSLVGQLELSIIWVLGHRNTFGNEKADELTKLGFSLDESKAELIACSLGAIKRELSRVYGSKYQA